MVAVSKKNSSKQYDAVKYSVRVIERGSDTEFGKETMVLYDPVSRSQFSVNRGDYVIQDSWK